MYLSYDDESVRLLIWNMKDEGYRAKRRLRKNAFEFHNEVAQCASREFGIECTCNGWRQKYCGLRKKYEQYKQEMNKSIRDGDDDELNKTRIL